MTFVSPGAKSNFQEAFPPQFIASIMLGSVTIENAVIEGVFLSWMINGIFFGI